MANSLRWARESAARGDFVDALGWVTVLEAIGEALSDEDRLRCDSWRRALAAQRSEAAEPDGQPHGH